MDRLAEIESKITQLQKSPKHDDVSQTERKKAIFNGEEACMFYTTPGVRLTSLEK